jgi:hypothetical protein
MCDHYDGCVEAWEEAEAERKAKTTSTNDTVLGHYASHPNLDVDATLPMRRMLREAEKVLVATAMTLPVNQLSYEQLRAYLRDLPMTWYPDLLRSMVEAAYEKKVFKPGQAGKFIDDVLGDGSR